MRIICGTDFSIYADAAAMAAASLAAALGLPLTLVHVLDPSDYSKPSTDLMAHLRRTRQKKLQALAERAGRRGVIVETAIIEGLPAQKLTELAARTNARLLVVSAIGQIALGRWLQGSVTDQATKMSPIPTLVIRDPSSFETWLRGDRRLKVMVGYDFSASSEAAIRWSAWLNSIAPCDITLAYMASSAKERKRLSIRPLSPLCYSSALRKAVEQEIEQKTRPLLGTNARICVEADAGRPDSRLIGLAADSRVDLIVVGTSRRRGLARFGSVARAVTHYSQKNVICVPERCADSSETPFISDRSIPRGMEQVKHTIENEFAIIQ